MRTDHRPWPIPVRSWKMKQIWNRLLFAHWPIEPDAVRRLIPNGLELDTYEGKAWLGIVPFHMSGARFKYMPPVPFASEFPELNVRTYVTANDKPGVTFFSMDTTPLLVVKGAKWLLHLPYCWADIAWNVREDRVHFQSERRNARGGYLFRATYRPVSSAYRAESATLAHWLTERYCLYIPHGERLYRCEIHHEPWALHDAEGAIYTNTMVEPLGLKLPVKEPLLHYSERQEAVVWGLEEVRLK